MTGSMISPRNRMAARVSQVLRLNKFGVSVTLIAALTSACFGQLIGTNPTGHRDRSSRVASKQALSFSIISAGQDHTCGLTKAGEAYCWGSNSNGQLGIGNADDERHEIPLRVAGHLHFQSLSAGFQHNCALDADGRAYCWGSNEYGQLGTGSRTQSSEPIAVVDSTKFDSISAGATHTCGVAGGHGLLLGRKLAWSDRRRNFRWRHGHRVLP